jgi:hypothetical protein
MSFNVKLLRILTPICAVLITTLLGFYESNNCQMLLSGIKLSNRKMLLDLMER